MGNVIGGFRRNINKDEFIELYLNTDMSIKELQKYYKVDQSTIYNRIRQWGLQRSKEHIERAKTKSRQRTMKELYGDENYNIVTGKITLKNKYNISNISQLPATRIKTAQTKLQRYGSSTYNNVKQMKQTKLEIYGTSSYNNREKCKQTCLKKYGVDNVFKSEILNSNQKEKEYNTRRKNNTLNKSKVEDKMYNIIKNKYSSIERQYRVNNMWFDFKIDDLLVELNGEFYHNYRPFNSSEEHIKEYDKLCNKSAFYKNIAITWRFRDTNKRNYCENHNLNLLVIYFKTFPENIIEIINTYKNGINIIQLNDNWVQRLSKT